MVKLGCAMILCLLSVIAQGVTFSLPVKAACNGENITFVGGYICNQKVLTPLRIKVKLPPTKGRIRIADCNRDLTQDGNPDDFNSETWSTGFWFWRHHRILATDTPEIFLYPPVDDNCPLEIGTYAEDAGEQAAVMFYVRKGYKDFLRFRCAGQPFTYTENGVAICKGLSGANIEFKSDLPGEPYIINIKGCGIQAEYKTTYFTVKMPGKICTLDVQLVTETKDWRTRFFVMGQDRSLAEIDSPSMIRDGQLRRVFKPLNASVMSTEIYHNGVILWKSEPHREDSYHLDSKVDTKKGLNYWPEGALACHTAYSEKTDSMSESCYDVNKSTKVPYVFY